MKYTKKKKINNTSLIDRLRKSHPESEAMLDLVKQFPLKETMEIITKNSGWVIKNTPTTNKGMAAFTICKL